MKRTKPSKEKVIVIAVVTSLAVIAMLFSVLRLAGYKGRVRDFQMALNRSTIYAYDHDCLKGTVNGSSLRITGEHNYDIYQVMCVRSLGANTLRLPREEAQVVLEYGDGGVLCLWEDTSDKGIFLRFQSAENRVWCFRSKDIRLKDLVDRYLSAAKNAPWTD